MRMSEVFGCGIDVEELSRFDRFLGDDAPPLMEDICTRRELNSFTGDKRVRSALSFSCKEAFFKALGVSWTNSDISWKDIEFLAKGLDFSDYTVNCYNRADDILKKNSAGIGDVSFVVTDEYVFFQVILM